MTTEERMSRLENVVGTLANHIVRLDDAMATLAESQITLTEQLSTLTERVDTIAQESAERDRRLGERIDSLVSAVGEFIRNKPITG